MGNLPERVPLLGSLKIPLKCTLMLVSGEAESTCRFTRRDEHRGGKNVGVISIACVSPRYGKETPRLGVPKTNGCVELPEFLHTVET